MPQCKLCNSSFPNITKIDGVQRNLSKRRYCLVCSPFGTGNRRQLHLGETLGNDRICADCKKPYEYSRSKGHKLNLCNSCALRKRHKACLLYTSPSPRDRQKS